MLNIAIKHALSYQNMRTPANLLERSAQEHGNKIFGAVWDISPREPLIFIEPINKEDSNQAPFSPWGVEGAGCPP